MASNFKPGLTSFLCNLMRATNDQVRRANPEKMAARYQIQVEHCRDYLEYEKMMRGMNYARTTKDA